MAQKIHILPQDVVLKIAAGEVVERPTSVVKELMENSLDAESKRIEVRVRGSGIENIEVIDDGTGISPEDIVNVFERHATSKITAESDLYKVLTYGFRGEALASIASVSKVELVSRVKEQETGKLLYVEGGEIKRQEEIAGNRGTRISVSDLFYNVPVRRKFLRSRQTENSLISAVFERFAIVQSDKYMKLTIDSRTTFELQPTRDLHERLKIIFGEETALKLIPFHYSRDEIIMDGFASPPEVTDIRGSYIYVNKRFVRDRLIQKAVQRGYAAGKERLEPYFVILFITLPPEMVDVNVHPQKYEVRFKESGKIFNSVSNAIGLCFRKIIPGIEKGMDIRDNTSDSERTNQQETEEKTATGRYEKIKESLEEYLIKEGFLRYSDRTPGIERAITERSAVYYSRDVEVLLRDVIPRAQLFMKYIICESNEGLLLIDQHAAHEILTFYKLKHSYQEKTKESQYLLNPEVIELPPSKVRIIRDSKEIFSSLGFDVEDFGENSVVIRAIPQVLINENIKSVISCLIDDLSEFDLINESSINKIISTIACHTSVRSKEKLSYEEMMSLVNDLREALISPYCPHGRPVVRFFPLSEIETWFRRR
jgi:DNA mismatch repair protein MutL